MAGIGIGPQSLANPVPTVDVAKAVTPDFAAVKPAPQADAPPVPMADPNQGMSEQAQAADPTRTPASDPFMDALNGPSQPVSSDADPFTAALSAPPSRETMAAGPSALFSLAENDKERQRTADKFYGKGSIVSEEPGGYVVTDPFGNKHAMPSGTLASWREAPGANFAAKAQLGLMVAAGLVTDAAAIGAAPFTGGASLAGLAATGAAGKATGDAIKGLAGTFDQTTGEQLHGLAMDASLNTLFAGLGKSFTQAVEQKAFAKAAANAIAADGGLTAAQKEAKAALQATDTLKQYGVEIPTLQAAITQNSKDVTELVKHSQTEAGQAHLKQVSDAMDGIFHKIADAHTGGAYSEALKGDSGDLTKRLTQQVIDFQKGSGKEIEAGRDAILKAAGDESYAAPKFQQAIRDAASSIGLLDQKGNVIPGNAEVLKNLPDDRVARTLYDLTQKHGEELFNNNGTMQASTLLDVYNGLAKDAKVAAKGSQYAGELFDLRRAALDDFHAIGDAKGVNLDTFTTHGNYRKAVETADIFSKALDNNAISAQALADQVINPSNLQKSQAMQAVIKPLNPGLWNDLVAQKLANITRSAISNPQWDAETGVLISGKMDYNKIGQDMYKLGKENVESMLGDGSFSRAQNLTGYISRMQKYVKPDMTLEEKKNLLAGAAKLGSLHGMTDFATNLISGLFQDKEAAAKAFFSNGADLESLTKGLRPTEKSLIYNAAKRAGSEVALAKRAVSP